MDATVALSRRRNRFTAFPLVRIADALTGVGCGLYLTAWLHQALGLGSAPISMTALQVLILGSLALACWLVRRSDQLTRLPWQSADRCSEDTAAWAFAGLHLALIVLAVFPTLLIEPAQFAAGTLTNDATLGDPLGQWLVALGSLAAGWLIPLTLAFTVLGTHMSVAARGPAPIASKLVGVSVGIVLSVFVPGLLGGAVAIALTGALLCCAAVGLATFAQFSRVKSEDHAHESADSEHVDGTTDGRNTDAARIPQSSSSSAAVTGVVVVLACGSLYASLRRVLDQLLLDTAWLSSVEWASILIGCAGGVWLGRRAQGATTWTTLTVAGWSLLLLVAFPMWVQLTLELKSTVSIALILMTLKALAAFCIVAPLGCCLGTQVSAVRTDRWQWQLPLVFCGGIWLTNWLILPGIGVGGGVVIAASLLAIVGLATSLPPLPARRRIAVAATAGLLLAVGSVCAHRTYDPSLSAQLLFDSRVFTTGRALLPFNLLPYFNEERCLRVVESRNRTLTFWKTRGTQIRIRESGVPAGTTGCEPEIGPQISAESLQAILPLALHERPTRLLLTGLSGTVLHTSLQFPLTTIRCFESDPHLIAAVSEQVLSHVLPNPLDDERVLIQCCEPAMALRATSGEYDVILCSAGKSVLSTSSAESTVEFLQAAAARLAVDGLCAQPLDIVDFGPQAVRIVIQTWQSAFEQVGAVEIAPGRLLLLGTNSPRGIFRPGFIGRLQHPHVRFSLAQTGWDWSTPLQLTAWAPAALTELYVGQRPTVSRVSNMTLTCWLPWEVARWGNKYASVRQQLGTQASSLQMLAGPAGQSADVLDRLNELREQQALIIDKPDQHWAYRATTKRMLIESPRSELVHVKGEDPAHRRHPEDKQRLTYFKALGETAKRTTADRLQAVADMDLPYDPLVTFFLHQEVAELAKRDRESFSDFELRHRLYRANYTMPGDHSVRNVIEAIDILCDHVAPGTDPLWRSDQLDALLQLLQERWANRGQIRPDSSRVVLVDIEKSIAAMERAFEVMPTLATARGQTEQDWEARQLVLEKLLVRPLRTYRSILLPHHDRERLMDARK